MLISFHSFDKKKKMQPFETGRIKSACGYAKGYTAKRTKLSRRFERGGQPIQPTPAAKAIHWSIGKKF
jgi:hypothetical protein